MKILITQDCAAPSMDGALHLPANTLTELETDVVRAIVHAGKGLYVDPKDDPSKIKGQTASEARIEAVRRALKAAKKPAETAGTGEGA